MILLPLMKITTNCDIGNSERKTRTTTCYWLNNDKSRK